ncbi:polysaccharide deacetylase family protein [Bacillus massiliigorillae]|uniref:polysaccharide deacetylase family protein n=1 Tax=Bacillus massiliigorillae TaxID=1243664 RepID=UPI0003A4E23A|nr:polysaccharide deacetylase family protein [Bacillus massiliigorillae]
MLLTNGKRIMKVIAITFTIIGAMLLTFFCNDEANAVKAIQTKDILPIDESDENRKVAYLTFDDGPSKNTIPILNILDQYKVKATFFVMANSAPEAKVGYKEMIKRGHAIALHTYTHDYREIYVSKDAFFQNIERLEKFLKDNYSIESNILRFPGGSKNVSSKIYGGPTIMTQITSQCETRGYRYFDWNVDSKDGISPTVSVQTITSNVLNGAKGKEKVIILLHDINLMKNTVTALPTIIEGLKSQGFAFDVIDDKTEEMQFK